ncbi:MAG: pyrroline-5-carboxylate reductase dimerization domain-containing protein [Alphaproteobacteria bacterium]|nr:pyrroline-5-carboxylate reductase dimerization domain-containing protein [Alphaproteobacteria bacterium]
MTCVGIIGVGYLGECLVEGLATTKTPMVLSPRNAERVARLADRFGCEVAASNNEVVERADLIFLAARPGDIAASAQGLPWRKGQRVVSIAAGISLDSFRSAVAPALAIRAMPIAASRICKSPTAFFPDDPMAADIFNRIGTAHPFEDEAQFGTASIFGAYYALTYAFIGEASGWAETKGLKPVAARQLAARMVQAAAAVIIDSSDRSPRDLLDDLMTPGGITEEGLRVLEETQAITQWSKAMEASWEQALSIDKSD